MSAVPVRRSGTVTASALLVMSPLDVAALRRALEAQSQAIRQDEDEEISSPAGDSGQTRSGAAVYLACAKED